jgi:hypothetical protein
MPVQAVATVDSVTAPAEQAEYILPNLACSWNHAPEYVMFLFLSIINY